MSESSASADRPKRPVLDSALSGGGVVGEMVRALDWSKTPLGPVELWPQSLKTSVSICLNSRFPVLIWWGSELVKIYNDAYVELIGSKHPSALGAKGKSVWPEIWETIGPLLLGVMEGAEANWADDLLLMLERSGYPEECYFTFSYSPIRDESGGIGGVFTPVIETTEKVIGERRMRTLRDLATARGYHSRDIHEACKIAVQVLSTNPWDIPFAAVYLINPDGMSAILAANSQKEHDLSLPSTLDLRVHPGLRLAQLMSGEHLTLTLAEIGTSGPLPLCPWGDPVDTTVVLPFCCAKGGEPVGYILAGVSPRKRLDTQYSWFFAQVADDFGDAVREALLVQREAALLAQQEAERTRLQDLFQQAPAWFAVLDGPDFIFEMVNHRYQELIGDREVVGKPVREAVPEAVEQGFIELLNGVYRSGKPFVGRSTPIHLARASGEPLELRYLDFVYEPRREADGTISGIISLGIDVTDKQAAEVALRASESRFRKLFESDLMGICTPGRFGAFYEGNDEFLRIVGYSRQDLAAGLVRWDTMTPPEYGALDADHIAEAAHRGSCTPYEKEYIRKDGSRVPIMCGYALLEGSQDRYVGFIQDLSAQKKAEEALRRAEKLTAAGRLAASMAHEINNPLMSVTNALYLAMQDTGLPSSALEHLKLADQELRRVSQMATQTLRFHRQSTSPVFANLTEIMDSVIALFAARISTVQLTREYSTKEKLFCCDNEIRQAFANVITNSLDATPIEGKLRISIRASHTWQGPGSRGIRVTVADTGHGIPADLRSKIFEPFLTTRDATGTGLGLWVTEGVIKKHKGRISVRSATQPHNHGTVFSIFFPFDGIR